ncbi:S66 peptidase family protein [Phytomonospora endophytica]|uniref:Muramoyltetrapeptide carboxypeptidase n=1 Tax=Phytomonospora endophytica TaxID=714109 RepID=A0A841FEZ5_9ACTN|nr:LD-carboxypeptidase [Phytomonospora endophytica]MBB6032418.1 muramoyltetrapeptide carboxypeptidase [Phytomonospora endophytica]GIG66436.1 muramoyltetrapeptide carboxypeptidase [Phytomonospora endophytica]
MNTESAASATRPPALRPGDSVRVVTPSGPTSRERLTPGLELLAEWGLDVQVPDGVLDRDGFLAGSDAARLTEFNEALADPSVRAVFCGRGGYGVTRIIDDVDWDAARRDPKPVIGYSDITALHMGLYRHAGVASVHGPVVTSFATPEPEDGAVVKALHTALFSAEPVVVASADYEPTGRLTRGTAVAGPLLGGNLSLVVDAVGTGTHLDCAGAILLLEEINEAPYRVDRALTQLRRAGVLGAVAGVALGNFTDCADGWGVDVVDVLGQMLAALDVPVLGGLPIGHGIRQETVPYGTRAVLDPSTGTLTVEAAVA